MLSLNDIDIKQILPSSISSDKQVLDLCETMQPFFLQAYTDTFALLLLPNLEQLSETLLDELAWQYHVDFYRDNFPLETKRQLVRTAIERHRKKGTVGAVEEIVKTLYNDAVVEEWFDYEADPYHFRVVMRATDPAPPLTLDEVFSLIDVYKSYRSHLDGIYYHVPHDIIIGTSAGWVCYWTRVCGVYPYRAKLGKIDDIDIVIETDNQGIIYRNPHTDELVAGTFPARATMGEILDGGITAKSEAGNTSYSVRLCGTLPGNLM